MILVFGGTTEGKQVIQLLNKLNLPFVYTTKTKIEVELGIYGKYRYGAFTQELLSDYIQKENIQLIIHASHPFAEVLHSTIENVAVQSEIPVLLLERLYPKIEKHPLVCYTTYEGLEKELKEEGLSKGLFLTGVQTIQRFEYYWKQHKSFFRILDRQSSVDLALEQNFPKENLILGMPNKEINKEVELIKNVGVDFIVTKESGTSGSLQIKIEAAKKCNKPIYIVKRPKLPEHFVICDNLESLEKQIVARLARSSNPN